jgi:small-conductance mechanosensitive channel
MQHILSVIPRWAVGTLIMIVPAIVVRVLYRWFVGWLARLAGRLSPFLKTLIARGEGPLSAILVTITLAAALPAARFPATATVMVGHLLLIVFILAIGWAAIRALDLGADLYLRRFRTDAADNLLARKHATQVHILRRTTQSVLAIITIAAALMTVAEVRQYGLSLFASAGAAGVIIGLAARPVLSNLIAGIQIAMTQPIRVEDAVVVEGEWGWIEKITSAYIVVRIWDLRRLIVPLSYFIEKPFQNWTYETTQLLGTVHLRVDYTVPIDRLRRQLEEIVRASPLWDGRAAALQVTEALADAIELRALVSARNASDLWDLRCEVREKLIAFVLREYPEALPRQRTELSGGIAFDESGAGAARAGARRRREREAMRRQR